MGQRLVAAGDQGVWCLDCWEVILIRLQPRRIFAVSSVLGELSQEGGGGERQAGGTV